MLFLPLTFLSINQIKEVFGSVVVVAFQSVFHSEKCANNIFLFSKNYF
jgi:hypothetical protein